MCVKVCRLLLTASSALEVGAVGRHRHADLDVHGSRARRLDTKAGTTSRRQHQRAARRRVPADQRRAARTADAVGAAAVDVAGADLGVPVGGAAREVAVRDQVVARSRSRPLRSCPRCRCRRRCPRFRPLPVVPAAPVVPAVAGVAGRSDGARRARRRTVAGGAGRSRRCRSFRRRPPRPWCRRRPRCRRCPPESRRRPCRCVPAVPVKTPPPPGMAARQESDAREAKDRDERNGSCVRFEQHDQTANPHHGA